MKHSLPVSLLVLLLLGNTGWLLAQVACDSSLLQAPGSALGYRNRGDRCEGLYAKPVGSTILQVVSFTSGFADFNTQNNQPLVVEWPQAPGASHIAIRVQGIKRRLYYRMDKQQPIDSLRYVWPTQVLASLGIVRKDIGITGMTTCKLGGADRLVYIPLALRQSNNAATRSTKLVLLPGAQLKEVYLSLAPLKADGKRGVPIKNSEKLGLGYYPAERGIEINLPALPAAGMYWLEIGATLENGASTSFELLFYTRS